MEPSPCITLMPSPLTPGTCEPAPASVDASARWADLRGFSPKTIPYPEGQQLADQPPPNQRDLCLKQRWRTVRLKSSSRGPAKTATKHDKSRSAEEAPAKESKLIGRN